MKPSEGSYAAAVTAWCSSHVVQGCTALAAAGLFGAPGGFHTELGPSLLAFSQQVHPCALAGISKGKGLCCPPSWQWGFIEDGLHAAWWER